MAAPACLLAHRDEPVEWPGYRTPHEQQVALGVHLHHAEAELRKTPRSHVAGHPLAFDDAGRVRAGRDRAGLAVPGVAVSLGAAAEVMAVHHALEPAALGHARDLHTVAHGEDRHGHALARLGRLALRGEHEALQHARRRLQTGLLHVAGQGLGRALRLLDAEAELGRQRDRPRDLRARLLRGAHDVGRGLVDQGVVEGFETDADSASHKGPRYFRIFVTTPAPTVRPPSRIANRSCSSIAIGVISSIAIFVLSPGITISTPAGSSTLPVTSVVRK